MGSMVEWLRRRVGRVPYALKGLLEVGSVATALKFLMANLKSAPSSHGVGSEVSDGLLIMVPSLCSGSS